ncbi:glycosyltransferase family 4 protein [Hyphococcus sp.]|uniref:glycosyltransferase family 4 protein n=1 Tax=Hyphococcus sp. TaxID=2038636 RepID=UPI003CCB80D2
MVKNTVLHRLQESGREEHMAQSEAAANLPPSALANHDLFYTLRAGEQAYDIPRMIRLEHTVLQIVPRLDSGGAERTSLEIAAALARAGGRAIVVSAGGRLARDIENAGGEVIIAPVHSKNPAVMAANSFKLANLITEKKVDLVHARSRAPAWSALIAARRAGIPFVTTYHGAYSAAGAFKRLYNSSMLRADRVIANSQFTADRILAEAAETAGRLRVIPRGVDIDLFDPQKVSADRVGRIQEVWGVGEKSGLKLLLPARLTEWKGHPTAIDAISMLKDRFAADRATGQTPPLTLVFCGGVQGKQDYERRLRAMTDERGVRSMVHIVGECADMPAAYAWADAVLAPSTRPEAFGRVVVEAGAMGKPVIASDHGGARETVIDGETGFLVQPGDGRDLCDAIIRIQNQTHEARMMMGEIARARAASVYSSAAMCDATLNVYRELLA